LTDRELKPAAEQATGANLFRQATRRTCLPGASWPRAFAEPHTGVS